MHQKYDQSAEYGILYFANQVKKTTNRQNIVYYILPIGAFLLPFHIIIKGANNKKHSFTSSSFRR